MRRSGSSSLDLDKEEAHIGLIAYTIYSSTYDKYDEKVHFFDLHSVQLAYHETLSNTSRITINLKAMTRASNNVLCEENNGLK